MKMKFTKMHGIGNDYLYFYTDFVPENVSELAIKYSNRRLGVGADGIIFILPSESADFGMRIFNSDGSEAKMCGNGIRCVAKYVYDGGYTDKNEITVETLAGIKTVKMKIENGRVKSASVSMGKATVGKGITITVLEHNIKYYPVDIGNPHAVVFSDHAENAPLETVGAEMEHHRAFPNGVNVEFVSIIGENRLRMRVYERGSGVTLACGTGASAVTAACVKLGYVKSDVPVEVILDGGKLQISVDGDFNVTMEGSCETVFNGEIDI